VDPDWEPDQFGSLSLSPDGGFLAIDINSSSGRQIWRKELPDGALTPLTTGEHVSFRPVWSPDGSMIAYSNTEGDYHIRTLPSDGSSVGAFTTLLKLERIVPQAVYTPDGRGLVYRIGGSAGTADIGYLDLTTGERDDSLHATEFVELAVALSPDGNWLAYVSNRSGDREVYVRRFPDMSGFQLVSRDGGTEPVWSRDREKPELFYRGRDGYMMAVTYSADSLFTVEDQVRLFDARQFRSAPTAVSYDYSPSEGRFIMVLLDALGGRIDVGPAPRLIMIQNFFTEVEERIGEGG
jgi:WD40 repeat protein